MPKFQSLAAVSAMLLFSSSNARELVATFHDEGVMGSFVFSQDTERDSMHVTLNLSGLEGQGGGYHVHSFPISSGCGPDSTGGHYLRDDGVDIGDLSGKHGSLAGLDIVADTYEDNDLTLFGPKSIAGRSVVIHRNEDGNPRWVCADIGYPREVTTVVANFASSDGIAGVKGKITLKQLADDPNTETSVLVDLQYADEAAAPTDGHKWHVHQEPVRDSGASACDVASTGGHYNPNDVDLAVYSCDGSSFNAAIGTCEVGDLSGKHGALSLDGSKAFYTDMNLPLSGPNSVLYRSIVLHQAELGGPRIACGTLDAPLSNEGEATAIDESGSNLDISNGDSDSSGDDNENQIRERFMVGIIGAFGGIFVGYLGACAWFALSKNKQGPSAPQEVGEPTLAEALSPKLRNLEEGQHTQKQNFRDTEKPNKPERLSVRISKALTMAKMASYSNPPPPVRMSSLYPNVPTSTQQNFMQENPVNSSQ